MKKLKVFLSALMIFNAMALCTVNAEEVKLHKMRATAYCLEGTTKTGTQVRKGICATSKTEWLGKTAIVYHRLSENKIGDLIGVYEIEDIGCKEHVIDVWVPDDECQWFMDKVYENDCCGKVWVQIIDGKG